MKLLSFASLIGVAVLALGVAFAARPAGIAEAAVLTMSGQATPAAEVPPATSFGKAYVQFQFDDVAKTLRYSAVVQGLAASEVTAAHIHLGAAGVSGPIVHNLSTVPGFLALSGTLNFTDADVANLRAGLYYFNVHSIQSPAGFARFQLVLPQTAAPAATPASVSPPRAGDGGLLDAGSSSLTASLVLIAAAGFGGLVYARRYR